eukprot:5614749-Karenia_brevis.AAC.1
MYWDDSEDDWDDSENVLEYPRRCIGADLENVLVRTSKNEWEGFEKCIRMTWKMYSNVHENSLIPTCIGEGPRKSIRMSLKLYS